MQKLIIFIVLFLGIVYALPALHDQQPEEIVLLRARRAEKPKIEFRGEHSSKYGASSSAILTQNLHKDKHSNVDFKVKYNTGNAGRRQEGWAGVEYGLRW